MSQNILPKSSKEFARKEYWDKFFALRNKAFEWYGNYDDLEMMISKYVKQTDDILIIGCGNSSLSPDMYDAGYHKNTSIDISKIVIDKMKKKYCADRPELEYREMSVFDMKFLDESFNVVLDKGTLDALASDKQDEVPKMFAEIDRILKPMGKYICISLLQENILKLLMQYFNSGLDRRWLIRIYRIPITESDELTAKKQNDKKIFHDNDLVDFPVFSVIITKLKQPMPIQMPVDVFLNNHRILDDKPTNRCVNNDDIVELIDSVQKFEFLKYFVRNSMSDKLIAENDQFCVELFNHENTSDWRFSLYFAKNPSSKLMLKCACFIVPQGREHEWLFSTTDGRENLRKQCQMDRLMVVHLSRKHQFNSIDDIKDELSSQIGGFFPNNRQNDRIQFLSIGDDVGCRKIVYSDCSQISGDLVVEDVEMVNEDDDDDNNNDKKKKKASKKEDKKCHYRRLIFLSNRNIIQSEAKLVKNKIDPNYLACEHHKIISAALSFSEPQTTKTSNPKRLLLIGLGGGGLVSFLSKNLSTDLLDITVVEIDPIICEIAKNWFNFDQTKARIVVEDGLKFIRECDNEFYDFIVFDVDCKDSSLGISCPPMEFVNPDFLSTVHTKLSSSGIFILNLVARNPQAKSTVYSELKARFETIFSLKIPFELNEILLAFKSGDERKYCKIRDESLRLKYFKESPFYVKQLDAVYTDISKKKILLL